jgi:outer membrane protein
MSSPRLWVLLSCLVLAWPGASHAQDAPQPPRRPVTLDELISIALANNRPLQIAERLAEKADQDVRAARTRQFPALGVQLFAGPASPFDYTFPAGAFGTIAPIGAIPPTEAKVHSPMQVSAVVQIEAAQPLTQLRRLRAGVRELEFERDVLGERRRARAQEVVSDVRRQYYAVLEARSAIAAADAGVTLYRELHRVSREQRDAETVFEADRLAGEAELARRSHAATVLRNSLITLIEQLGLLVGRELDPELVLSVADELPQPPPDLAAALSRALAQRPDVREAELRVQQAQLSVAAKRAERMPDVSVVVRVLGFRNVEVLPTTVAAAGVSANWQPFDWGRKRRDIAASTLRREATERALDDVKAHARADVGLRSRQLGEALELVTVTGLARRAARARLDLTRSRFEAGAALRADMLQAEATLAESERDYRRALAASWSAHADLQRAIGEM